MPYCGKGATLWRRKPLLIAKTFTFGHSIKIERLVTDVTGVRSPDKVERAILGVILAESCFAQFRSYLWPGRHFMMYECRFEPK